MVSAADSLPGEERRQYLEAALDGQGEIGYTVRSLVSIAYQRPLNP